MTMLKMSNEVMYHSTNENVNSILKDLRGFIVTIIALYE